MTTNPVPKPQPYTFQEFRADVAASIPFLTVHAGLVLLFFVGFSWTALIACLLLYVVRMFGITAGFHRYFAHRSFRTSRFFQFLLALVGTSAAQRGPLWWASHHRYHHRHSDSEVDIHSPRKQGVLWAHMGWIFSRNSTPWNEHEVRDLARYRELVWLTRWHAIVPIALALGLFGLGALLERVAPGLGTNAWQMLAWGFFLSTVLLYHATFTINSLSHLIGYQSYKTDDDSRNNLFLALLTLGEGWHNNHHRYPASEKQGFFWYQIDLTHYLIRTLGLLGIVWDIKTPPEHILAEAHHRSAA